MNTPVLRTACGAVVLAAVSYAFIGLHGHNGISAVIEKRRQLRDLQAANKALSREIEQQKREIRDLKTNPAAMEREIREKLHMQRPNEKVYITGPQQ